MSQGKFNPTPEGRIRPRSAHLSAVWGRNRNLCVNVLSHGHLVDAAIAGERHGALAAAVEGGEQVPAMLRRQPEPSVATGADD